MVSFPVRRCFATRLLFPALLFGGMVTGLLIMPSGEAHAQDSLSIKGRVVNGTAGAAAPGGLVVLMLITGPDGTLGGTGQTEADPDGAFALDDVPLHPGSVYNLSVDYGGVFYGRSLQPDELEDEVVITVHEATEDASIILVERQVMVIAGIDEAQRIATATEFVRFTNPTDRTLRPNLETARPGMFSFMRFALPPNAADVTVQSNLRGGEIISVGSGFALTAPVPPGQHSVDFAYTFPYESSSLSFRNSLPQGAGIFQVLIPDRWPGVEVGSLTVRPPVGIGDQVYRAWEVRDVPAGPGVDIRLDGLPQPGVTARVGRTLSGGPFWMTAIPSATGAALLALLVLGIFRRYRPAVSKAGLELTRSEADNAHAIEARPLSPHPQRAEAVASLAALDERYLRGDVEEDDYLQQRAGLTSLALGEPRNTEE